MVMKKVKMVPDSSPVYTGETGIQAALRHKKMQEMKKKNRSCSVQATR